MAKKVRKKRKQIDEETGLRYMYVLEQNDMNIRKTAQEVGTSREQFYRWKAKWWDLYRDSKVKKHVIEQSQTIAAVKFAQNDHFVQVRNELMKVHGKAMERLMEWMEKGDIDDLSPKDLIQAIHVTSPYVAEKIANAGADDPSKQASPGHTTLVQNIIRKMNIKGQEIPIKPITERLNLNNDEK